MRKTVASLNGGVYAKAELTILADYGFRRFHLFSFDFDSTPLMLKDPDTDWSEAAKLAHMNGRAQMIERLKHDHGAREIENKARNLRDLGPKAMSLISYHNDLHEQSRRAFVTGAYYPALVAACALGERILNHLVLDLRGSFMTSHHFKKVHRKSSFDDWLYAVDVLFDWGVIDGEVAAEFRNLCKIRNRSIHFNVDTYHSIRDDALTALHLLNEIIAKQFGYFGQQRWFIEGTPGAQFVKRSYEADPFVRTYIVPRSGFVGPLYGMELTPQGHWHHIDHADYGDGSLDDDEFARRFRERDPEKVVSRAMIEKQRSSAV